MPIISRFRGIEIRMYFNEDIHPGRAHFHAWYAGKLAVFDVADASCISGELPPRIERLVREWAQQRRAELLANWDRARADLDPRPIDPLK
ncbi:MAG TPA: DUF4160 domain-containing protein [Solirubrobacterales bacterium]|nr:DUF4160 domain-containing protein [Solirubrobacterales bacterium]